MLSTLKNKKDEKFYFSNEEVQVKTLDKHPAEGTEKEKVHENGDG